MNKTVATDIYAGLSGLDLQLEMFDFGDGVILSQTYAHLMAPFLMYFERTTKEKPHPRRLKAAHGGLDFDIIAQIYLPKDLKVVCWEDHIKVLRFLLALLRLGTKPSIVCPVISNIAFADAEATPDNEVNLIPFEVMPRQIRLESPSGQIVEKTDLEWVRDNWRNAEILANKSKELYTAIQAHDQIQFMNDTSLALLSLWAALEDLFSPAKSELRFRISANIAAFMEEPGKERLTLQKRVAKLYDARSHAAHSRSNLDTKVFLDTLDLLRQVIVKMIRDNHVPTREELESRLFGAEYPS